jgi:hypothetical protein
MHRLFAIESPSSDHYERVRRTARELTVEHIRLCRHLDDLARCEAMLVQANSGWLYGLDRAFTRAERGELLVEVRNRIVLLGLGRTEPKPKGPRLDPMRLPDAALLRLIQKHADPHLVEQLRAERQRRLDRIASPFLLLSDRPLPHLECSRQRSGGNDEEDEHGNAERIDRGGRRAIPGMRSVE